MTTATKETTVATLKTRLLVVADTKRAGQIRRSVGRDQIISAAEHASTISWLRERHQDDGISAEEAEARLDYWITAAGVS